MKRVFILSTILMIAGAMNAWAAECAKDAAGKYGAITIATVDGKCVATLDPNDTTSVNIPNDIAIDQFVYNKHFKVGENPQTTASRGPGVLTLCLPFSGVVSNGNIYEIISITKQTWDRDVWQIGAQSSSQQAFKAGVPYFVLHNGNVDTLNFIKSYEDRTGQLILNSSELSSTKFGTNKEWEFRGTYTYKKWEEGDSQIGHVYGFVASDTTTASGSFKAGQFVKVKAGAFIKPMRAYLYYNKTSSGSGTTSRPAANGVKGFAAIDDEDLPNTIEVVFQDDKGEIQSIAKMNTVTGEFTSVTGWYDMKGRKLDKKPTQKGTYFNNGKKVVIK